MASVVRLPAPARPPARPSIAHAASATDQPDKPYEVRSKRLQGLILRVEKSGTRTFYVQVNRDQRVRLGRGDRLTLKQAEEDARKIMRDPAAALATKTRSGITLAEYIDAHYSEHALARLKNGARSVGRVKALWKPLLAKRIADVTSADVDKLRNKRLNAGIAPATVNRDVAALSGVFAHWAGNNKGAAHPLAELEALDIADDETIRYLSPEESKRLRQALAARDGRNAAERANANAWRAAREYELLPEITGYSDHITPMVLLSLNTGARRGELFSMAWEHIDMKHATLSVLASHSKGNKTRTVPLNDEALQVLQAIKPKSAAGLVFVSPITGGRFNNVKKAWAEVTKAAKLPDLRWHDLRHDFASQLVMRGAPLFTVQKLLGHSNPKMTQRYARLAPSTLADAVGLLGRAP